MSLETSKKNQNACCRGENLAKLGPMLRKKSKEIGIINRFFSYFAEGIHFKARRSGCTNT